MVTSLNKLDKLRFVWPQIFRHESTYGCSTIHQWRVRVVAQTVKDNRHTFPCPQDHQGLVVCIVPKLPATWCDANNRLKQFKTSIKSNLLSEIAGGKRPDFFDELRMIGRDSAKMQNPNHDIRLSMQKPAVVPVSACNLIVLLVAAEPSMRGDRLGMVGMCRCILSNSFGFSLNNPKTSKNQQTPFSIMPFWSILSPWAKLTNICYATLTCVGPETWCAKATCLWRTAARHPQQHEWNGCSQTWSLGAPWCINGNECWMPSSGQTSTRYYGHPHEIWSDFLTSNDIYNHLHITTIFNNIPQSSTYITTNCKAKKPCL